MTKEMNSIERVAAAIELRIPDRVPVDLHNFQPAAKAMGVSMAEVFQDGELLAESMLLAWREFGHDMILLENGTACNAQACGAQIVYRNDAAPAVAAPVLERLEDVDKLEVPDPYTAFPMCEILRATRILAQEIGDQAWIVARADQGPFDLAAELYGMENLLVAVALGEQDELVHRLLEYCRRVATRYAFALIEAGGRSTSIGEPFAGPELMSPRHYRKFALPHEKAMVDELKAHGIILANHICGNTIPIIHDFVGTGAQILEIDHKTDMQKAKDAARGKTCLLGPINTLTLATGTPQEVDDACREAIAIMAPASGFILGPGCALSPETPAENIHALVESARKYGIYR
jgi:MtaA/CmuA family methyltransferase